MKDSTVIRVENPSQKDTWRVHIRPPQYNLLLEPILALYLDLVKYCGGQTYYTLRVGTRAEERKHTCGNYNVRPAYPIGKPFSKVAEARLVYLLRKNEKQREILEVPWKGALPDTFNILCINNPTRLDKNENRPCPLYDNIGLFGKAKPTEVTTIGSLLAVSYDSSDVDLSRQASETNAQDFTWQFLCARLAKEGTICNITKTAQKSRLFKLPFLHPTWTPRRPRSRRGALTLLPLFYGLFTHEREGNSEDQLRSLHQRVGNIENEAIKMRTYAQEGFISDLVLAQQTIFDPLMHDLEKYIASFENILAEAGPKAFQMVFTTEKYEPIGSNIPLRLPTHTQYKGWSLDYARGRNSYIILITAPKKGEPGHVPAVLEKVRKTTYTIIGRDCIISKTLNVTLGDDTKIFPPRTKVSRVMAAFRPHQQETRKRSVSVFQIGQSKIYAKYKMSRKLFDAFHSLSAEKPIENILFDTEMDCLPAHNHNVIYYKTARGYVIYITHPFNVTVTACSKPILKVAIPGGTTLAVNNPLNTNAKCKNWNSPEPQLIISNYAALKQLLDHKEPSEEEFYPHQKSQKYEEAAHFRSKANAAYYTFNKEMDLSAEAPSWTNATRELEKPTLRPGPNFNATKTLVTSFFTTLSKVPTKMWNGITSYATEIWSGVINPIAQLAMYIFFGILVLYIAFKITQCLK